MGVDFSSTSNTIGTGTKTFTLTATASVDRDWPVGSKVIAVSQAGATGTMTGVVASYDITTQVLVITVASITGSGTSTNWRIGSLEFRYEFDPVTFTPKGGLVEGGATNLNAQSATAFNVLNATVSNNSVLAPDGSVLAATIAAAGSGQISYATQGLGVTTVVGTSYISGLFVKRGVSRYVRVSTNNIAVLPVFSVFDFDTGSVVASVSQATAFAIPFGNGWFFVGGHGVSTQVGVQGVYAIATDSAGVNRLAGADGEIQHYQWGGVISVGNGYSSYIPTTTVSVTRAADQLSVGGTNFSQFYNATQGTLVMELTPIAQAVGAVAGSLNDGTLNNAVRIQQKQSGTLSSIRDIATDGVTDVMAVNAATGNTLRSNGVDYLQVSTGSAQAAFGVVSLSANTFIAVGANGSIRKSTDGGLTYAAKTSGVTAQLNGVAFGNGVVVAAGAGGVLVYSTDLGETWAVGASNTTNTINDVFFENGAIYAPHTAGIQRSTDGIAWTSQTIGGTSFVVNRVAHDGTRHIAVGSLGRYSISTDNGLTWAASALTGVTTQTLNGLSSFGGTTVACGNAGTIITTTNGTTWTLRTSGVTSNLFSVMYSTRDSQWYAAGDNGVILRATDPTGVWTTISNQSATAVTRNGIVEANPQLQNLIPNAVNKVAMRIQLNNVGGSTNGSDAVSDTNVIIPTVTQLTIGNNGNQTMPFNGHIRKIQYYDIPLSDIELKGLSN